MKKYKFLVAALFCFVMTLVCFFSIGQTSMLAVYFGVLTIFALAFHLSKCNK